MPVPSKTIFKVNFEIQEMLKEWIFLLSCLISSVSVELATVELIGKTLSEDINIK